MAKRKSNTTSERASKAARSTPPAQTSAKRRLEEIRATPPSFPELDWSAWKYKSLPDWEIPVEPASGVVVFQWGNPHVYPEQGTEPRAAWQLVTTFLLALGWERRSGGWSNTRSSLLSDAAITTARERGSWFRATALKPTVWDDFFTPKRLFALVRSLKDKSSEQALLVDEAAGVTLEHLTFAEGEEVAGLIELREAGLDLTRFDESREPRPMREGPKRQETSTFDDLASLAAPKQSTPELRKLAAILEQAKTTEPPDKRAFINAVNAALESHSLAIRIDDTGEICRKLRLDRNNVITLQKTTGPHRGFYGTSFTLVPYVRPYRRSK